MKIDFVTIDDLYLLGKTLLKRLEKSILIMTLIN